MNVKNVFLLWDMPGKPMNTEHLECQLVTVMYLNEKMEDIYLASWVGSYILLIFYIRW